MYELIHAERADIPTARACRVLQVARSGYYKWLHAKPSTRLADDAALAAEVKGSFTSTAVDTVRLAFGALSGAEGQDPARSASRA